jgi:diguanylate cyclase (GGDEF)-like protein/PAS domain S-box-containing protein
VRQRLLRAWPAVAATAFVLAAGLDAAGLLSRLEHAVADARAGLLAHTRESDIVIVGIDTQSLDAFGQWPWPRRYHANLLRALSSAEPAAIFLDIDFSSRAPEPDDDAILESALDAATAPVYLAAHFDPLADASGARTTRAPLPRFAQHARLASVVLKPGDDGLVREMRGSWQIGDEDGGQSELTAIFAHDDDEWRDAAVQIDYSIARESFAYASYIDVANRAIAAEALRGKRVFVGAVANALGDILQVPVHGALPGVVVQALAAESARSPLRAPPGWLSTLALGSLAALAAFLFNASAWRRNLLYACGGLLLLGAATLYLQAAHRVVLEVVPYTLVLAATFVACALRSLDREQWRALANALRVRRRDALLKSIVESSADSIVCVDSDLAIRTANPAALRLFRPAAGASLLGARLDTLVPDLVVRHGRALEALAGRVLECTADARGDAVPVEIALSRIDVASDALYTAVIRDVSERHAQRRALEHQATHDSLTGLPNRAALHAHVDRLLGDGQADSQPVALLMLDLTRFKEVNDTLGHDVGDEVLCEVAARFADQVGDGFIARIGGDEFTVVVSNVVRRDVVNDLARRLLDGLRRPVNARGIAIEIGVNIGVAFAPNDAQTARDLLRRADVAMYAAKRRGTGCEHYDREQDQHTVRRLSMLSELRSAIEGSGIGLHYQPQVDLRRNRVTSVEALVRWQHAMHGAIGPAEFITLAESSDLIGPLTDWTITRTLQDLAAWQRQHLELRAAVNVSARVLQDVDFPSRVRELLATSSVRPDRLELEITESAMMVDPERARRIVEELHSLGVAISIDDYGTGFSSLGYLRDLRVHALKLDRSFVVDLEERAENRVIVESTVQMAHALGLVVVAEGVESESVAHYLRDVGYDLGQGYWFARPMPADDCSRWALKFNSGGLQLVG